MALAQREAAPSLADDGLCRAHLQEWSARGMHQRFSPVEAYGESVLGGFQAYHSMTSRPTLRGKPLESERATIHYGCVVSNTWWPGLVFHGVR